MKKIFLFIVLFAFAYVTNGCSDDDKNQRNTSLIGTWKLVEIGSYNYETGVYWQKVENGYTRTFGTDELFTSNQFSDCGNGSYILSESESSIKMIFDCENFTEGAFYGETFIEGTYIENYEIIGQYLITKPTYYCGDEGCSYKFIKK